MTPQDDFDRAWRSWHQDQELEEADLSNDRDAAIDLCKAIEDALNEAWSEDGYCISSSPEVQTRIRQFAAVARLLGLVVDDPVRPKDMRLLGIKRRGGAR